VERVGVQYRSIRVTVTPVTQRIPASPRPRCRGFSLWPFLAALKFSDRRDDKPLALDKLRPPIIVVVTESWNKLTDKALSFALSISPDLSAVHLKALRGPDREEDENAFLWQWHSDVEAPARAAGLKPNSFGSHRHRC
jgi:hypothetical protein